MENEQTNYDLLVLLFFKCGSCQEVMNSKIYDTGTHQICEKCFSKPASGEQPSRFRNFAAEAIFSFIEKQGTTDASIQEAILSNQKAQAVQVLAKDDNPRRSLVCPTAISPNQKAQAVQVLAVDDSPRRSLSLVCPTSQCMCTFSTFENLKKHVMSSHGERVIHMRRTDTVKFLVDNKTYGSASMRKMVLFVRVLFIIDAKISYDGRSGCNVQVSAVHHYPKFKFRLNDGNLEESVVRYDQCRRNIGLYTSIADCKNQELTITIDIKF